MCHGLRFIESTEVWRAFYFKHFDECQGSIYYQLNPIESNLGYFYPSISQVWSNWNSLPIEIVCKKEKHVSCWLLIQKTDQNYHQPGFAATLKCPHFCDEVDDPNPMWPESPVLQWNSDWKTRCRARPIKNLQAVGAIHSSILKGFNLCNTSVTRSIIRFVSDVRNSYCRRGKRKKRTNTVMILSCLFRDLLSLYHQQQAFGRHSMQFLVCLSLYWVEGDSPQEANLGILYRHLWKISSIAFVPEILPRYGLNKMRIHALLLVFVLGCLNATFKKSAIPS